MPGNNPTKETHKKDPMWDRINSRVNHALQTCQNYNYFDYAKAAEKKQLLSYLPKVNPGTCKSRLMMERVFGWGFIMLFGESEFFGESAFFGTNSSKGKSPEIPQRSPKSP